MNKQLLAIFFALASIALSNAQSLKQAIDLTNNEQFDEATKVYKQLIKSAPSNGENYYFLGDNFFAQGAVDSANFYYNKGVEVDPNNPLNYVGLGKVMWFDGKTAAAQPNFDKALTMAGKNIKVYKEIAKCYTNAERKELDKAFKMLDAALAIEPKDVEIPMLYGDVYNELGDGSKAIEQYKKAQAMDKKSCLATLRIGQLYGRAKNYNLAIQYYQDAANIDSSFAPAYREQAELFYKAGQFEKAKSKYRKFLELSSNNLEARRRYASFLFLTKDYSEAINQLQQVRSSDTTYNMVNRLLAFSYYEGGKYQDALNFSNLFFSRQVNEKNKLLSDDYSYRGKILSKLGQDSAGVSALVSAYQMDTTKTELYSDIAMVYSKMKKYTDAAKYYELKLKSKKGITTQDYYALGKAYFFTKEYAKADTIFGTFISVQPKLPNGYLWRAKTKTTMDPDSKLGLAKPYYEKYLERVVDKEKEKKDMIEAYSYLGYYFFQLKDKENSKTNWLKVKELDPANDKADKALKALN